LTSRICPNLGACPASRSMRITLFSFSLIVLFLWFPELVNGLFSNIAYQYSWPQLTMGFGLALALALPVLHIKKRQKLYLGIVYLLLLVPSLTSFVYLLLFGIPIRGEVYFILFEAPPSEVSEFFFSHVSVMKILLVLFYSIAPLVMLRFIKPVKAAVKEWLFIEIISVLFITLLYFKFGFADMRFYNTHIDLVCSWSDFKREKQHFEDAVKRRKEKKTPVTVTNELDAAITPVYVIVIGESTSRTHMSIYGYGRETDPGLERIKNELCIFNNVTSPYTHTIPCLRTFLTFATRADSAGFYDKPSLISLFKAAGYETWWLSNQKPLGIFDTEVSAMASEADHVNFIGDSLSSWTKPYDGSLLAPFESILRKKTKAKVIFVHLIGTHEYFSLRYPKDFDHFRDSTGIRSPFALDAEKINTINAYDNAVRYNDHIIDSLITLVKRYTAYSYLLYFSDHGEEVYDEADKFSHSQWESTSTMYKVPFVLWTSADFRAKDPSRIGILQKQADREYCTENVIHSILQLSSLSCPEADTLKSLFSGH
jgi:heptose-I-phosphate ethanolaminephosphotransferase